MPPSSSSSITAFLAVMLHAFWYQTVGLWPRESMKVNPGKSSQPLRWRVTDGIRVTCWYTTAKRPGDLGRNPAPGEVLASALEPVTLGSVHRPEAAWGTLAGSAMSMSEHSQVVAHYDNCLGSYDRSGVFI